VIPGLYGEEDFLSLMALEHLQMKMGDVGKNQEEKKKNFFFFKNR